MSEQYLQQHIYMLSVWMDKSLANSLRDIINLTNELIANRYGELSDEQTEDIKTIKQSAITMRAELRGDNTDPNPPQLEMLRSRIHGLRTPLNSMIGFSQLFITHPDLYEGYRLSVGQLDVIRMIYNTSHHLLSLVTNAADYSKLKGNQFHLGMEVDEFSLTKLLQNIESKWLLLSGLPYEMRMSADLPPVLGEKPRVQQTILAMWEAVFYTAAGNKVLVEATAKSTQDVFVSFTVDHLVPIQPSMTDALDLIWWADLQTIQPWQLGLHVASAFAVAQGGAIGEYIDGSRRILLLKLPTGIIR